MFALRGARLFDGVRMVDRPTVLVEQGRVVAVGVDPPSDVESLSELPDVTLLPGLVDCHQHLCFDGHGTLEEQVARVNDTELATRARASAELALGGGVTTVRDLGDRSWITLGLRDDPRLPAIVASGPPITRPDGHCWYLGGGCTDADSIRNAVRERVERGCDVVKVMTTGGALTESYPMWECQFDVEELRLIVDSAHAAGLPVASHCHATQGIEHSLEAGVDSIEHCTFFTANGRSEPDETLLVRLAESGVAISATVGRLPDAVLTPLIAANLETMRESRRRLHELGALLVGGTDAGITEAKPHDVLPRALGDFLEAGMTAIEGLQALTSKAADVCGLGHTKGRLAPGYDADIVAVTGDPMLDAAALTSVVAVWLAGARIR